MIAFARRASAILFSVLRARADRRPFLLPANICPVVPETFRAAERAFELVDVSEASLAMDPGRCLERARAGGYAGLLFARPYGSERDPTEWFAALREADPDLFLIDDKCLCAPDCDGASLSPLADVTLFSTGSAKYADAGTGGFAHVRAYEPAETGPDWLDLRRPDLSWDAYRDRVLAVASAASAHKAELNAIYARAIPAEVQLAEEFQQWRFNLLVEDAPRLVDALFAAGLFASRHYPPLGDAPVAARLHARVVNLFNDRHFTPEQARQATEIVSRHLSPRA